MNYLIKDLSEITGLSPARIRKWQQRYNMLTPEKHENGYWYYNDNDIEYLQAIDHYLARHRRISDILKIDRDLLIEKYHRDIFTPEELEFIEKVNNSEFDEIESEVEKLRQTMPPEKWITEVIRPMAITTGKAWDNRKISISEEHTFSRWLQSYLFSLIDLKPMQQADILVAVFPGDEHELGAVMYLYLMMIAGYKCHYRGSLDEEELLRELDEGRYREVHISVVIPHEPEEYRYLEYRIKEETGVEKILFGGAGYHENRGNQ